MTHEQFNEERESMPDTELIALAKKELHKLCDTGGSSFTMSIPARVKDTDIVLEEVVRRYEAAVKAIKESN